DPHSTEYESARPQNIFAIFASRSEFKKIVRPSALSPPESAENAPSLFRRTRKRPCTACGGIETAVRLIYNARPARSFQNFSEIFDISRPVRRLKSDPYSSGSHRCAVRWAMLKSARSDRHSPCGDRFRFFTPGNRRSPDRPKPDAGQAGGSLPSLFVSLL